MLRRVARTAIIRQNLPIRSCLNLFRYTNSFKYPHYGNFSIDYIITRLRSTNHSFPIPKSIKMATDIEQESKNSDKVKDVNNSDQRGPSQVSEIKQVSLLNDDNNLAALDSLAESYKLASNKFSSTWLDFETCYIYLYRGGGHPNSIIAAFDLDGTLIKPKSKRKIPKGATDWDFFSVWTKVKLQQAVHENKARFVIFTNQNGIGLKLVAREEIQERIELVTHRLGIPCTVLVATEKDEFRKPKTGMFELFIRSFNNSEQIDCEKSFYCGDAVGYPSHSDADIKFAQSLGLPFLPPEKFLRGVKPKLVQMA